MTAVQIKPAAKQQQQNLTPQESLIFARNVVRSSIATIAYHRQLITDDASFEHNRMGGRRVPSLIERSAEAATLLKWVDRGVFQALSHGYLAEAQLLILDEHDVVLETYAFKFSYLQNQQIAVTVGDRIVERSLTRRDAETSLVDALDELVSVTEQLPPLPLAHQATVRLLYNDSAPADYHPNGFRLPAGDMARRCFGLPDALEVGEALAPYHSVGVEVRTANGVVQQAPPCGEPARAADLVDLDKPLPPESLDIVAMLGIGLTIRSRVFDLGVLPEHPLLGAMPGDRRRRTFQLLLRRGFFCREKGSPTVTVVHSHRLFRYMRGLLNHRDARALIDSDDALRTQLTMVMQSFDEAASHADAHVAAPTRHQSAKRVRDAQAVGMA